MSDPIPSTETAASEAILNPDKAAVPTSTAPLEVTSVQDEPPPSYVKLAMRNMVKKRGTSLYHFALTTLGLLVLLVGLAYLTR
ncbi:MAG TPA: DUF3285 domain-containing protein [Synechococcales cyanobacterium M55_K2018_004]|nr:DUF3285 domain-containing protein [Synechococcales cyanobacterium M55_K2018_004]